MLVVTAEPPASLAGELRRTLPDLCVVDARSLSVLREAVGVGVDGDKGEQPTGDLVGWHRFGEEEALTGRAAEPGEGPELVIGLDPLGGDDDAKGGARA